MCLNRLSFNTRFNNSSGFRYIWICCAIFLQRASPLLLIRRLSVFEIHGRSLKIHVEQNITPSLIPPESDSETSKDGEF